MSQELQETLEQIKHQEATLVFASFDESDAWSLGSAIRATAAARSQSVAIEITRGDATLFFTAMPGTAPANQDWARRKRNLVNLLHFSSYQASVLFALGNNVPEQMGLDTRDFARHGGAFPITVANSGVIGCITVSGLPQREDHLLVVEEIAKYLNVDL